MYCNRFTVCRIPSLPFCDIAKTIWSLRVTSIHTAFTSRGPGHIQGIISSSPERFTRALCEEHCSSPLTNVNDRAVTSSGMPVLHSHINLPPGDCHRANRNKKRLLCSKATNLKPRGMLHATSCYKRPTMIT